MNVRKLLVIAPVLAGLLAGGAALAQSGVEPVVVIEVADPLDQRSLDYVERSIRSESAHLFVLKIDSPGISSGDPAALFEAVVEAPAPVVAWVGPDPAVAYGGAAYLANHADIRSAAPGVDIGYLDPAVLRGGAASPSARPGADVVAFQAVEEELAEAVVAVGPNTTIPGFIDRVDPALGQLILSLDGTTLDRAGQVFEIDTARIEDLGGEQVLVQSRPITFVKAGLLDRLLRLGAKPETAFLFLVFALAFAAFEFYAAGSGLMALVAGISLSLSAYGMATLPMWWPAVGLVALGFGLLVWGFVQNRVDWRAVVGAIVLLVSGFTFTSTRPQYPPAPVLVVVTVAAAVVFVWYTLTTVVRGRFATPTVGREDMLGRRCLVVETLDPFGVVVVDGARWRATADRGVEISAGAPAQIVGVTGLLLEVDPVSIDPGGQDREIAT